MDLKIKDVVELLNVSETTIRRWLAEGKIPAYRLNHQYRFSRFEIEDWVMSQKLKHTAAPFSEEKKNRMNERKGRKVRGGNQQYSLYRAIHKGGVLQDIPGKTKEEVIRATMQLIANKLKLDVDVITELLLDRESLQSTALNNGLGLPHTRDCLLTAGQDVVTVVFPETPIPYEALDGEPVHTLFFLFACDDKRHLHLLAKIAHLSQLPETLTLLRSKPSKQKLLEYIKEWEGRIQKVQKE
ncbi:MAG: PTS sugar transporter subunit IIA [Waddliaceae bacterium]